MEGPTPEWANVDDYATLEEVFESPDFGHPIPAAAATAGLAAALASTPGTHLLRNRAIALTSVLAATLSVVLGLLFTGPASTPVLSAQHAPPARAGHGAGPVPFTSPTPPAGRAGATTAPTTPPSPSSLGGSQLASSSSSSGRGQGTTFGTGTGTGTGGAAPATPAPTATLTVLTNNPPTTTTPTAPTQSTATTTTTTTAPPRKTTTPTTSPPRWPTTTTTAPPKVSSGGASGGSGRGSGNSGGSSGCDCNCNGYESSDGGGKRDGTATSTAAAPERAAPARVSARGRAGTW
ncbi:MAG TPA: hypothetical protein VN886_20280 [Acidimicrobiales bacterium]|nr:hypothetical protein [Acidimicrobiales bacterium]